jgi:UDP-GlcNAc:undecaprenyl-phosphate GlcNAc-1-phosphate transferase
MTILAVPVLILFVPIFDTTFVTVLRKLWGRKASQGGRDHTSHRLVALGLTERNAVLMLYGFAICAGLLSLAISQLELARVSLSSGPSRDPVIIGVIFER